MAMVIATVETGNDQTTVTFEISSSPTITSLLAGGDERIWQLKDGIKVPVSKYH
jgi:hypothetical protein